MIGHDGQAWLLAMLSAGPLRGEEPRDYFPVYPDQFVDLFRRLQTPGYEEARQRFGLASVLEAYADANEVQPYTPSELRRIAELD